MAKTQRQHVEDFGRIGALFNRAIASSSQREKDCTLAELRQASVECVQALEKQIKDNERKKNELSQLQEEYKHMSDLVDKTSLNKRLLDLLCERNDKLDDITTRNEIDKLEADIKRFDSLERPNLRANAERKGGFVGVRLYDVKMQRMEEDVYALRKRILNVDGNQELTQLIRRDYGNTMGLVKKYDELLQENERLRNDELIVSNDPISKRRGISGMSSDGARNLAAFLQLQYKTEISALDVLGVTTESKECNDFDSICADSQSTDSNCMKNSSSNESINDINFCGFGSPSEDFSLNDKNSMENKLQMIQKENRRLSDEAKSLMDQYEELGEPVFDPTGKFHGRDGKLLELLTYLVKDYHNKNISIIEAKESSQELMKTVKKESLELRALKLNYLNLFAPFNSLEDSYIKVLSNNARNVSVNTTLSSVSSALSLKNTFVDSYLKMKTQVRTARKSPPNSPLLIGSPLVGDRGPDDWDASPLSSARKTNSRKDVTPMASPKRHLVEAPAHSWAMSLISNVKRVGTELTKIPSQKRLERGLQSNTKRKNNNNSLLQKKPIKSLISVPKIDGTVIRPSKLKYVSANITKSSATLPPLDFLIEKVVINPNEDFVNFFLAAILCELLPQSQNSHSKSITQMWDEVYRELREFEVKSFDKFSKEMKSNFEMIKKSSHQFLAYEKEEAAIQTDNPEMVDMEVQNEDKAFPPLRKKPERSNRSSKK